MKCVARLGELFFSIPGLWGENRYLGILLVIFKHFTVPPDNLGITKCEIPVGMLSLKVI